MCKNMLTSQIKIISQVFFKVISKTVNHYIKIHFVFMFVYEDVKHGPCYTRSPIYFIIMTNYIYLWTFSPILDKSSKHRSVGWLYTIGIDGKGVPSWNIYSLSLVVQCNKTYCSGLDLPYFHLVIVLLKLSQLENQEPTSWKIMNSQLNIEYN